LAPQGMRGEREDKRIRGQGDTGEMGQNGIRGCLLEGAPRKAQGAVLIAIQLGAVALLKVTSGVGWVAFRFGLGLGR
jgi:hypothetical protein